MDVANLNDRTSDTTSENTARVRLWGWIAAFILMIALLVLLWFGLRRAQQGPFTIGDPVPNFSLTTFAGQTLSLADYQGKVVVINFWASWCKPCEQEAADLEAAWKFYQPTGDVVFLGVDYVDTEPEALAYLERFGITYPNGPDLRGRISQAFRISGVPETYIVDRNGNLADKMIGPFTSLNQIKDKIEPLLTP